jgi:hypothetical protein
MFRPNTIAQLLRMLPTRTIHGKESFAGPVPIPCSIVQLADRVEESSVRADSTATRGAAEQEVLQAKILVPAHTVIKKGDVLQLQDRSVEVMSVHQRLNTRGVLDHLEIGGNIKGNL